MFRCVYKFAQNKVSLAAFFAMFAASMGTVCGQAAESTEMNSNQTLQESHFGSKDYVGTWQGKLVIGEVNLPLVFHFSLTGSTLKGTLDSPAQGGFGIPIDVIETNAQGMSVRITQLGVTYDCSSAENGKSLRGQFRQGQIRQELTLARGDYVAPNRPQEPKPPFPYKVEEVSFSDGDVKLAGTITRPDDDKKHAGIVLVHGSGPHKRDEPVFLHKPFLVLADYLTRQGYVVLRYDKRGVGASTGSLTTATTADFADDADAAVKYLQSDSHVNPKQVGIIGHSEGGTAAMMAASKDASISFIVLLAGPAEPADQLLLKQLETPSKSRGMSDSEIALRLSNAKELYSTIKSEPDAKILQEKLKTLIAKQAPSPAEATGHAKSLKQISTLSSPWFRAFIQFDPVATLRQVKCPVLALNGAKDVQVRADDNLPLIESALKTAGNTNVTVKKLPELNHLFQTCTTGLPNEYQSIDETINPSVLTVISHWLAEQTN